MGTSQPFVIIWLFVRDHPHACGDKLPAGVPNNVVSGSSPRVWGQVIKAVGFGHPLRIIPTRVGTSQQGLCCFLGKQDHPHACGDKQLFLLTVKLLEGSSPRVWGQVSRLHREKRTKRIIPTRVGTSHRDTRQSCRPWDHPHACGDKIYTLVPDPLGRGSSPRVWGQVALNACISPAPRIIPTRVGTSSFHILHYYVVQDHPHACGDKRP